MITIISSPSKCQLRQITGSDNDTTGLVCNIHQALGTFPCLTILISDIMYFRIMPDISEMKINRLTDIHFFQRCPQTFA